MKLKISGVGIDLIEIHRIEKALTEHRRFAERIFCPEELEGFKAGKELARHAAARFAAKEAVAKALGTGISGFSFKDIVILKDEAGKPIVELRGKAREIAKNKGVEEVAISLSFTRTNAVASAVALSSND